jgi:curved DNA-binding protein
MSYYTTLGISTTATEADIKSAFRRLAAKHHPDKGGDAEKFKTILEAYNTLKDPAARQQYDQRGRSPFGNTGNSRSPFGNSASFHFGDDGSFPDDIGDLFRSFTARGFSHNGNQHAQQEKRNRDVRVTLHIPLHETLVLQSKTINVTTDTGLGETLYVTIPKGASTGTRIKYPGLGDDMFKSLPRGDLYVNIVVDDDPRFSYNNTDLYTIVEISPFDAILGGETEIRGLDNKLFSLTIPPGTQPNIKMRIANQGLYHQGTDVRGHLYVTIVVKVPKNLTDTQTELVKQLKELLDPTATVNDEWMIKHRKRLDAYLNTLALKDNEG